MVPLLQRRPGTGRMKECWTSLSSSPSLSLSLIDMWNLGLSLAKRHREKLRERDRERGRKGLEAPRALWKGCWALSGQRLTQTVPSLSLFLWPRLQSSALWLTTLFLYFCVNLPVIFPICLDLSVNLAFCSIVGFLISCLFLLLFFFSLFL